MMDTENTTILTQDTVAAIQEFIKKKFESDHLEAEFPNKLLREDVMTLLDRYCTVIYYPLENESNNGFHITDIPDKNGIQKHFVFINTAQTIEKQAFTAAHELGHIWRVDEKVCATCGLKCDGETSELIINRFAAELLIPINEFKQSFSIEYTKYQEENGTITLANMLKVIVALMNQFFAPEKAIIIRCVELQHISKRTEELLMGLGKVPKDTIDQKISDIIQDNGYIRFQVPNMKKWIEGFSELLDRAESSGIVSQAKIDGLRKMFSLKEDNISEKMDDIIN